MFFHVFVFVFLFRTNGKKEHLDENDFRQGYGNCFESAILKVKVLSQQLRGILTKAVETHLTVKDFTDMDQHTW